MDHRDWDERYRTADLLWSPTPNAFVERELGDLAPGRAIDLAAGEGRNALWLASRGWRVTAVDFSAVALDRGRARAAELDLEVDWVRADLTSYEPETGGFDAVLVAYLHLPWPSMEAVLRRAAAAVVPGGTFLLVGHDADNLSRGYGGPQSATVLYTPAQVVGALTDLQVACAETVERAVDTAEGPRVALDCLVRATRAEST